jgi:hypothetical protein
VVPSPGDRVGPGAAWLPTSKPARNLGWAFAALVLFWPLSIPAFVHASRVDPAWHAGDRLGALTASQSAKTFGLVGVVVGVVVWILALVWVVVIFAYIDHTSHAFGR